MPEDDAEKQEITAIEVENLDCKIRIKPAIAGMKSKKLIQPFMVSPIITLNINKMDAGEIDKFVKVCKEFSDSMINIFNQLIDTLQNIFKNYLK